MPTCATRWRAALLSTWTVAWLAVLSPGTARAHPRLLLSAADLPRVRHLCGVQPGAPARPEWGRFGARAADFQALRAHAAGPQRDELLPGELLALAFVHLVDPADPADRDRLAAVSAALGGSARGMAEPMELVLALDWCWPDLPPATRRDFLFSVRARATPLTPADSPLEPRSFREKLACLALAVAVDETDESNPSWVDLRQRLLAEGRTYFTTTFPAYVQWRGLSPTSSAAAREECDTALAVELAGLVLGCDTWPDYAPSVGRWLEHYVLAALEHPALDYGFIHDDGSAAPLTPVPVWRDLLPITAHLVATRTRDAAAALLADRVESDLRASAPTDAPFFWRWVPIVLALSDVPRCDATRLPTARNLGGAVVFRGGSGPDTTAVWIDAAQPFLRRRQHFDAGHFLIRRGGELVVDGGEDVVFEAVPTKGGSQQLGSRREPFDFEQYFTATIAHNCLLVCDTARVEHRYQARYLPVGGQRCVEHTCADFSTPLESQKRRTGRQLAYGWQGHAAYLALDLAAAYEPRSVSAYTREFVFFWDCVLILIDRVTPASRRMAPTWIVNISSQPRVDGYDFPEAARIAGRADDAGVWSWDAGTWLRWTERDGALWLAIPLPRSQRARVVGGPARQLTIKEGRYAGRTYVGGDADSFEHLIVPAGRRAALNAWYRLGEPTALGSEFGKTPHWGRVELEPAESAAPTTFLAVFVTDRADAESMPGVALHEQGETLMLQVRVGEEVATLRVPAAAAAGGTLEMGGRRPLSWVLPTKVKLDPPLPVRQAASP